MELIGAINPERPLLVVALHGEAAHLDTDLPILITGVGKLAAATSLLGAMAARPAEERPSKVINLGTAGALRDGVHGTHQVGAVHQHDLDGPAIEALTGHNPSPILDLGDGPVLATGDAFVADPAQRAALAAVADLCDMEGYAIASAARRLGLEVVLVKHVSDGADHEARTTWVEAVAHSSHSLGDWLRSADGRRQVG